MNGYEYDLTPYQNYIEETVCKYKIKVHHVNVESTDPSLAYPEQNTVIINDNYQSRISPIFIMAHEIYHVINNGSEQSIYAFSPLAKITEEKNAHLFALKLFFDTFEEDYIPNYIAVMYALGLPLSMEHLVRQVWSERSSKFIAQ